VSDPMSEPHPAPRATLRTLGAFLLIGSGCAVLLAATVAMTRDPIARNRAAQEAGAILDLTGLDAPPATGTWQDDVWVTCDGFVLLRGAAQGYGGPIRWMLSAEQPDAAAAAPRIRRLLITTHQETPGIADFLDDPEHPWLQQFGGRSADVVALDTISGATITTRALIRSVGASLAGPLPTPTECSP
jgi:Na+-translocating ferredoxin:NAD+ oxidoreductase RnfG subunit